MSLGFGTLSDVSLSEVFLGCDLCFCFWLVVLGLLAGLSLLLLLCAFIGVVLVVVVMLR